MKDQNRVKFSEAYARYRFGNNPKANPSPESIKTKQRVFDTFQALTEYCHVKKFGKGVRVLDLGCGDGSFVECCRREGLQAEGLDLADGIDLENDKLPFSDHSFDFITGISIIEHLWNPVSFFDECQRVLVPGGCLILVTPNWRFDLKVFYQDPTHVKPYTETSLKKVLTMFGFQQVEVLPWLVKKPKWMWDLPYKFEFAKYGIPFRGNAPAWIPSFFKGKSGSVLALAQTATEPKQKS